MKFHWTTAVTQFLSHSLPPTAPHCSAGCLLHQQAPPTQRFGEKTKDTKEWCSHQTAVLHGFLSSPLPSPWPPTQLRTTKTWGLAALRWDSAPTIYLCISRLYSRKDHEWLILPPFIVGLLCVRHCVRHTPPGVHRPRRGGGGEHRQLQSRVCAWKEDTRSQEDIQGT